MARPSFVTRRVALRAGAALAAAFAMSACAHSIKLPPPARLVDVEVRDRTTGATLPVHEHEGRAYIVGQPGHEYAIRIRNLTGQRVLAVTSVDGVNVVSGDTASPEQSGYVLEAWGSVEIAGWRKSLSRTAAFFFTAHENSYAARTGRPHDVGVIGVAAFAERRQHPVRIAEPVPFARDEAASSPKAEAAAAAPPADARRASAADARSDESGMRERSATQAKLGTGHGRDETSHVRQVRFERSTSHPLQLVSINYDRYENLAAIGVVPRDRHFARRVPDPFPALRFVPDPR